MTPRQIEPPTSVVLPAPVVSFHVPMATAGEPVNLQWSPDARADGFDVRPHGIDRDGNPWAAPTERVDDPIFAADAPAGSGTYCVGVIAIGAGNFVSSSETVACVPFAEGVGDANCDGVAASDADVLSSLARTVGLPHDCLDDGRGSADVDGDGTAALLDALLMTQCASGRANVACPGLPPDADPIEFFAYMLDQGAFPNRAVFEELDFYEDDKNTRTGSLDALNPASDSSFGAQLLAESELANPDLYGAVDRFGNAAEPDAFWSFDIPSEDQIDQTNAEVTVRLLAEGDISVEQLKADAGPAALLAAAAAAAAQAPTGPPPPRGKLGGIAAVAVAILSLPGDTPIIRTDQQVFARTADGTQTYISDDLEDVSPTLRQLGDGDAVVIADYAERRQVTVDTNGNIINEGNIWSPLWFEDWNSLLQEVAHASLGAPKSKFRTKVGGTPNDGCDAHHIIPQGSENPAAVKSRAILNKNGIGIHDPVNGALLNRGAHARLHTQTYYEETLVLVRAADESSEDPVQRRRAVVDALVAEGERLMADPRYRCVPA